jgi:hypothetical protein
MESDVVTVVSGLPRSGTSMLMKMLEAGGIPPLTDQIRVADEDNPKGYFEFERVKKLPEDTEWLKDARGKTVKVLAELVKHLPNNYVYKIIFIDRKMEEIIASQKKMLIRRGEDPNKVPDKEIMALFSKYKKIIKKYISQQANMDVLYVSYNEILEDPTDIIVEINEFLDGVLDENKMRSAIDGKLYRNRA